jgi:hypothetical protein
LGLVRMLDEDRDGMTADAMITAIRRLPHQNKPSEAGADGILDGLKVVMERATALMDRA